VESNVCDCEQTSDRELALLKHHAIHIADVYLSKGKKKKEILPFRERYIYFERLFNIEKSVSFFNMISSSEMFITGIVSMNSSVCDISMALQHTVIENYYSGIQY